MEEIDIRLDFTQKVPLAEQISTALRRLIHEGLLEPGDPLPPVRELAAQLGVNFNTTARAYRALDLEGLITTRQGRGTFVREAFQEAERTADLEIQTKEIQLDSAQRLERLLDHFLDLLREETGLAGISEEMLQRALQKRILRNNPEEVVPPQVQIPVRKHKMGNKLRRTYYGLNPLPIRSYAVKRTQKKRGFHT